LLYKYFKPEFLNRIDEIITFKPLTPENIVKIAGLQIEQLQKLLADQKITMTISDQALAKLAAAGFHPSLGARPLRRVIQHEIPAGFHPSLGARPLRRVIQHEIQDKLAMMILDGSLLPNAKVFIDFKKDNFVFKTSE